MADTHRPTLADIFAVLRSPSLTEHEKVLWGLYRSYDRGDGAWPGDETIQEHMGAGGQPKSLRAVRRYRSSLIEKGYLVRELRGPHPAVYLAVVPQVGTHTVAGETPARDGRPSPAVSGRPSGSKDRPGMAGVRRPDVAGHTHIKDGRWSQAKLDQQRQERYGISPEQYAAMVAEQGDACAVCRRKFDEGDAKTSRFVDHCHQSGRVRGIVCMSCNIMLGHACDDPTVLTQGANCLAVAGTGPSAQAPTPANSGLLNIEDRPKDRPSDRPNLATTPTPPIREEYGEYGETAEEAAAASPGSDSPGEVESPESLAHHDGIDGLRELGERYPEASAVLARLKHPGGEVSTKATLRMRFLYVNGEGMPDDSVRGLPLERRVELVAAALIEGMSAGWEKFNARSLAGFVRPLREKPDPEGDHPGLNAAEEQAREAERREAAHRRQVQAEAQDRLDREAEAQQAPWREAKAWIAQQPEDVRRRGDDLLAKKLTAKGLSSGKKPPLFILGPLLTEVVNELRAKGEQAAEVR